MSSSSIPLPALAVNPPQPVDALGAYQKLMALRSLANQQQLQQQQMASQQQEQQLRQQQINDQQSVQQYLRQNPTSTFGDAAQALKGKISVPAYTNLMDTDAAITQKHAQATEAQLKNVETAHNVLQGVYNNIKNLSPQDLAAQTPQIAQQINSIPGSAVKWNPNQPITPDALEQFGRMNSLQEAYLKQEQDKRTAQATAFKEQQQGAEAQANTQKTQAESAFYSKLGLAPGVTPDMAAYADYLQKGGKPEGWTGFKAQQEAAATQPFKIQTAQVEAQTRMTLEGMAKPVYAYNPQTNSKDLMSQSEAIAQGRKVMTPVTAKEVSEDTMLINRLSDVRQKIAEYENSLQQPISQKDRGNMAALLGTSQTKVGVHPHGVLGGISFEVPMERLDAALSQENLQGLSAAARDQLVAYRNAREALTGYTRVLSGSGRSSDQNLELQEQTLPDPSFTDPDFSRRSLGAFKQNLQVVGQGLPNIPGVKTPEQWAAPMTQQGGQGGSAGPGSMLTPQSKLTPSSMLTPQSLISPSLMSLIQGRR